MTKKTRKSKVKARNFLKGDRVIVRSHTSKPGKGLTYLTHRATLLEDAGAATGWDVIDVKPERSSDNKFDSVYAFDIIEKN